VVEDEGRLLLVRRGTEPGLGRWSVPGGRVEPGESVADALVREVLEETGLRVEPRGLVGRVERDAPDGSVYVIEDHRAQVVGGSLRAGDDAAEVAWFTTAELCGVDCVEGLLGALREWGVLPPE
jgi:ADP-ribose pyrophosphatase YjhB (NUDIX family)